MVAYITSACVFEKKKVLVVQNKEGSCSTFSNIYRNFQSSIAAMSKQRKVGCGDPNTHTPVQS